MGWLVPETVIRIIISIFLKVLKNCKSVQINFTIFQQSGLAGVIQESNFAPAMKKTAAIFLLLFAFLQAAPLISSYFSDSPVVFIADEGNGTDKSETEKKEKKEYSFTAFSKSNLTQKVNIAFHQAEMIHPDPCLEKLTPPPNFC